MTPFNFEDEGAFAVAALTANGLTPDILARVGALAIYWGMVETRIEPLLWKIRGDQYKGVRPVTYKKRPSELITEQVG